MALRSRFRPLFKSFDGDLGGCIGIDRRGHFGASLYLSHSETQREVFLPHLSESI